MKFCLAILVCIFAQPSQAKLVQTGLTVAARCSTADVDPLDRVLVELKLDEERAKRDFKDIDVRDIKTVKIPVYVHILAKDKTELGGYVSDQKVKEQMSYLNAAYASMNIFFELKSIDRIVDKTWFNFEAGEDFIKKQLHKGDNTTLNLYIAGGDDGVLGWAYFPWEYTQYPLNDGVVVHFQTLPNGAFKDYNEGGTTVHEVGHWLGLYHVFEDGCADGDQVVDTPPQREANFGCPKEPLESCKKGLKDSIHNYMDYSDDICMQGFTKGQTQRVHNNISAYRKKN